MGRRGTKGQKQFEKTMNNHMTFDCNTCGKKVYLPLFGGEGWGWKLHGFKFCSWSCQRQWQREENERIMQNNKEKKKSPVIDPALNEITIKAFEKLIVYETLRKNGVKAEDASLQAGYPSKHEGAKRQYKYRNDVRYKVYKELKQLQEANNL